MTDATDPASLAHTAAALRRLAREAGALSDALAGVDAGRERLPGRTRAAARDLDRAATVLARVSEDGGAALTRAAHDHARLLHERSVLDETARAGGLVAAPGGYALRPGISGVADTATASDRASALERVRERATALDHRESDINATLAASLDRLAGAAQSAASALR